MNTTDRSIILTLDESFLRKLFRFLVLIVIVAAFVWMLPLLKSIITLFIVSFLLAFLLEPVVDRMESYGLNRVGAIVILFSAIALVAGISLKFLAPIITHEMRSISQVIETQGPTQLLHKLEVTLTEKFPLLTNPEIAQQVSLKFESALKALLQKSVTLIPGLISTVIMLVIIPFITFFLLKDGRRMKKMLIQWVPNRYFEMSLNLLYKINQQLGNYVRGQLLVALIVGILSIIALYLLHISYFFVIGAMAGLANMIPYFGPVVGAIPAILVAIIQTGSFAPVLAIVIAFAVIQLLDNVLISPLIVAKSVELHPLLVIMVIIIGGNFLGILGMLLAVPATAIIKVTVKEIYWGFKNYHLGTGREGRAGGGQI